MAWKHSQAGIAVQFFLSYCAVGILMALVSVVLGTFHLRLLTLLVIAGLIAGLVGLLLTWNIQRGLQRVDQLLVRLLPGEPIEQPAAGWLFARISQLSQALERQIQREALTSEQREQLLRTVSEAAVQEERNRLARELHDSIKQQLFSIGLSAAAIEVRLSGGLTTVETPLADIQQSVQAAQGEMEALLQQLRPATLSLAGVIENLRTQCLALAYRMNGEASVDVGELPPAERLPPTTADALQRILQEALSNIARHAHAHQVRLFLGQQDDELLVELTDDGQGFAVQEQTRGMGLTSMQTRAQALGGSLQIQSRPGKTVISLRLPLAEAPSTLVRREQVQQQVRRTRLLQQSADVLVQLTGLSILLTVPFTLTGIGLLLAIICLLLAVSQNQRIARLAGEISREALRLQNRAYETLVSLLLLLGLSAWYLPVALPHAGTLAGIALPTVLMTTALTLALLACGRFVRSAAVYARQLSTRERKDEGRQRQIQTRVNLGVWLGIVILTLFIGQLNLALPPQTLEQWSSDAAIALLTFWPILELASYLHTRFWIRYPGKNLTDTREESKHA
jgi:signal transduction histidine kinase